MSDPFDADDGPDDSESVVSTATLPRESPQAQGGTGTRRQPPYHVVILNDEEHTFDYVIELLTKLFAHPMDTAEQLTWRIHKAGRAVVYTTHREKAELKREQVLGYGADPRMSESKGPLGCYIEPAES